jgi:HSP20 family molecular chaperone IbpA
MFKKKCSNCGKKIDKKFYFCPFCGEDMRKFKSEVVEKRNGLLDEIDESEEFLNRIRLPFGFNALFNRLTREIEKQLRDFDKILGESYRIDEKKKLKLNKDSMKSFIPLHKSGVSISISSIGGKEPVIKVKTFGMPKKETKITELEEKTPKVKLKPAKLTKVQETKLAGLPKQEPETRVRRLTDKIVYEIDLPGVKNKKDIIINKLENSIEIKALGKDKVFFKLIPVSFPIKSYNFKDGKLILELKPET